MLPSAVIELMVILAPSVLLLAPTTCQPKEFAQALAGEAATD
jgi:hypothetical protein